MAKALPIIIIIVALAVIGIVTAVVIMSMSPKQSSMPSTNQPNLNNPPGNPPLPSMNPAPTTQTYNIAISNFAFSPSSLTIKKGDKVVWTNSDSASHTVTSDAGNEIGSSSLSNGQTYSHTFNTAGTFNYHCSIHPSMKASITVQ